jgi:ribosomal protein L11 methyltransferase
VKRWGSDALTEWLAVSVTVEWDIAEAVAEVLMRSAPSGVVINSGETASSKVTVLAYLSIDEQIAERVRGLEDNVGHLQQIWPVPDPVYERIPDQDWMRRWKKTVPVFRIGERFVIKPSWREYTSDPDEIVVEIDPGQAFGLGVHATTQLCLRELGQRLKPGMHVLDLGTGSGILSIAAVKLAEVEVVAVDHDADSVAVARENIRLNQVADNIHLKHGSLKDVQGPFDLILANLFTSVILRMVGEGLTARLSPGGVIVASGILEEQAHEVVDAFERHALNVERVAHRDDWVAVVAKRRASGL